MEKISHIRRIYFDNFTTLSVVFLMKRALIIILLSAISTVSGYLMSGSTWIGKVGISFFHREYNFTKIWWQGAVAVFIILLVLFFLHALLHRKLGIIAARSLHFLLLLVAGAGLYLTYDDFHHNFTHRMLGHHFHNGFYLIWIGWMIVCVFFIFSKGKPKEAIKDRDKTEPAAQ